MKFPKIDLKKVDMLEEKEELVKKVVIGWAKKSLKDPNIPWDVAMKNAADELGLNKAEFTVLIFGRDPFDDVGYALGIYETLRECKFEPEKLIK
ncbi:MAG: hypothetical protein ACE5J9_11210, partial [Methanosarcinales archaeon]